MNKIELQDINKANKYQGYLWWSDQQYPKVYDGEILDIELDGIVNPFIIEGQLYDVTSNKSYSIKYVEGKHIVIEYKLNELNNVEKTEQPYLSNRMNERTLSFYQYWEAESDNLCEGMEVLKPAKCVFVGFKNKEE